MSRGRDGWAVLCAANGWLAELVFAGKEGTLGILGKDISGVDMCVSNVCVCVCVCSQE